MSVDFKKITPYYLLNIKQVIDRYDEINKAIERIRKGRDCIAYSIKANYNEKIIKTLNERNVWFEVCSKKELEYLRSLNISAKKIIINGNIPFEEIVNYAEECLVILDSEKQVEKWIEFGHKQQVGLRINVDSYLKDDRFKNKNSRFGINISFIQESLTEEIMNNIVALQCHLSGNTRETSIYGDVIEWLHKETKSLRLKNLKYIDIGGGYKIGFDDRKFDDYIEVIDRSCAKFFPNVSVIYEPGNSLVNSSMDYYTKVISEKILNGRSIKIVDGSILHLPHTKLENRQYKLIGENEETSEKQEVFGATCKESDIILQIENGKKLYIGDTVVIKNVGAYCVNEVTDFIIKKPNIYMCNLQEGLFLGGHFFEYVCDYLECFNKEKANNYKRLNIIESVKQKGLYAFVDQEGVVLYIGVAYERELIKRIKQHFGKNDTGSIRYKFRDNVELINRLDESRIFVCPMEKGKKELLCEEATLIGLYSPEMCFGK